LSRLRLFIALVVAVMALQAVPSGPLPLHLDNGPAFSASSVEMALPARRPFAAEPRLAPIFPPLASGPAEIVLLVTSEFGGEPAWPAPYRVRPPRPRVLVPAAPPRGPPLS
jgi:hypothetical protein